MVEFLNKRYVHSFRLILQNCEFELRREYTFYTALHFLYVIYFCASSHLGV